MLNRVLRNQELTFQEIYTMQDNIDSLRAAVARQTSVTASVVEGYKALAQQIRDAADDPAEVRSLAEQIEANTDALASATVENTSVADEAK